MTAPSSTIGGGATHFPHGVDVSSFSVGGTVIDSMGSATTGNPGATHFPHGISANGLSINGVAFGGTILATKKNATHFPHGIDVGVFTAPPPPPHLREETKVKSHDSSSSSRQKRSQPTRSHSAGGNAPSKHDDK